VETGGGISVTGRGNLGAGKRKHRHTANGKVRRAEHFKDKKRHKSYALRNRASRGDRMDLRCPQCNSSDLKKVSLAYQEGSSQVKTHSRLRAIAVGGDGPDVILGRIKSAGTAQTELSKVLSPPRKWSYRKLIRYWLFAFVVCSWIVIALDWSMTSSKTIISIPFLVFVGTCLGLFVLFAFAFWKHNGPTFRREYARWNRSYICNKCGEVSEQKL
jgi:hypothetical protein